MTDYPYDADVLALVAQRLLRRAARRCTACPTQPPAGRDDLQRLLEVLAAPLAVLRQSIQELHADLFIDTADDRDDPLPRRDGRDAARVPRRRRPTAATCAARSAGGGARARPGALEEMGAELTGQPVVLQEGWKRIQLAQDLDLVRAERVVADVRPAIVAEQADGPLDALFHAVDVRPDLGHHGPPPPAPRRALAARRRHLPAARGDRARPLGSPRSDARFTFDPARRAAPLRARRAARRRPRAVRRPHLRAALRRRAGALVRRRRRLHDPRLRAAGGDRGRRARPSACRAPRVGRPQLARRRRHADGARRSPRAAGAARCGSSSDWPPSPAPGPALATEPGHVHATREPRPRRRGRRRPGDGRRGGPGGDGRAAAPVAARRRARRASSPARRSRSRAPRRRGAGRDRRRPWRARASCAACCT